MNYVINGIYYVYELYHIWNSMIHGIHEIYELYDTWNL